LVSMKSLAVIFLLSFVAFVCSQNFAQIGTFEGTYNDLAYHGHTYICQNGDVIQGSFSQVAIVNGIVSGNTASGKIYQAGLNDCTMGTFNWTLTDEGFEGTYTCNNIPGTFPWVAKKYDVFRPTDDQCALLYDGDANTQGHWTIEGDSYTIDAYITNGTISDDYTLRASYQTENSGETYPNIGYIAGYSVFSGKIFIGTWYEDFRGGAVMGFLNIRQELVLYFWTGLAGRQGASIIDASELHVPDYHWVSTYHNSVKTTVAQCERNSFLQPYVLDALYYYVDGDIEYIYFAYDKELQFNGYVGFDALDYQDSNYYLNVVLSANTSSYLTLSLFAVVVAILF